MIKKIIFDLYGTIVKAPKPAWFIYEGLLKDIGMHLQERSVRDYYRRIALIKNHKNLEAFVRDLQANVDDYGHIIAEYQKELDEITKGVIPKGYSERAISCLKNKGIEMYALSNATRPYAEAFNRTSLAGQMTGSMFSCYAGFMKPDKEFFLKLLSSYDVYVNEAVMIGDSQTSDINGAHSIGMKARRVAENDFDLLRVLKAEGFLDDKDVKDIADYE